MAVVPGEGVVSASAVKSFNPIFLKLQSFNTKQKVGILFLSAIATTAVILGAIGTIHIVTAGVITVCTIGVSLVAMKIITTTKGYMQKLTIKYLDSVTRAGSGAVALRMAAEHFEYVLKISEISSRIGKANLLEKQGMALEKAAKLATNPSTKTILLEKAKIAFEAAVMESKNLWSTSPSTMERLLENVVRISFEIAEDATNIKKAMLLKSAGKTLEEAGKYYNEYRYCKLDARYIAIKKLQKAVKTFQNAFCISTDLTEKTKLLEFAKEACDLAIEYFNVEEGMLVYDHGGNLVDYSSDKKEIKEEFKKIAMEFTKAASELRLAAECEEERLERKASLFENEANAHESAGKCYVLAGEKEEAIKKFEEADGALGAAKFNFDEAAETSKCEEKLRLLKKARQQKERTLGAAV